MFFKKRTYFSQKINCFGVVFSYLPAWEYMYFLHNQGPNPPPRHTSLPVV